MEARYRPGDAVVYRKQEGALCPHPRAKDVRAAPNGDYYSYYVAKYWRVIEVRGGKTLIVRTRKGKQHTIDADDPNLRPAYWWERLLFRRRMPAHAI